MKSYIVLWIIMLFLLTPSELKAQTNKSGNIKKNLTVKDLNKLELEKIKTISVKPNLTTDTSLKKDTLLKKQVFSPDTIKKVIKNSIENNSIELIKIKTDKPDSSKIKILSTVKESVIHEKIRDTNVNTLKDSVSIINAVRIIDTVIKSPKNLFSKSNEITVKEKISKTDSLLYASYLINARFADSVRNANKYWLDSTMSSLPKKKPVVMNDDDEIEIFVSGGGFYAGVNPKMYDRLTIYHSGLVHREFKTKLQGEQIEEKKLSKEELKKLAQFIIDMGFFDYNNVYDCNVKDMDCKTRMKSKPEPVALSVSVAIGARRKRIYVAFFAPKMERNYVAYPASLEKIIEAIFAVIAR
jgi:hypothetical protein